MSTFFIGSGFDRHRLVEGRPLIIGGVPIDSPVGCDAHSDGDVLLHALVDALLGATGRGDIGDHFPPSDPKWKDAKSERFVHQVLHEVRREVTAEIDGRPLQAADQPPRGVDIRRNGFGDRSDSFLG